jgi:predicted transcriptional regulator
MNFDRRRGPNWRQIPRQVAEMQQAHPAEMEQLREKLTTELQTEVEQRHDDVVEKMKQELQSAHTSEMEHIKSDLLAASDSS